MDKKILIQYSEMREEIRDIRRRIRQTEISLGKLETVSDSVKGTRKDGTYGNIRVTGYPTPEHFRKERALKVYKAWLENAESELMELTGQAEEYIESIEKSELRIMFRFYYIDGLNWVQVAHRMNEMFPRRRIKFTDENCWRRNQRFFEENSKCRAMSV